MLSIGQFSKTCMVTVKTLRHYDKIGLLHPEYVNDENGYRFYSAAQLPRMLLISRLKSYGFSLSDIKELLAVNDTDILLSRLRKQSKELDCGISQKQEILRELNEYIHEVERTNNIMAYQNNYDVSLETTQDMEVISNRQVMSVDDFGKYYGYLYKRCMQEHIVLDGKCMAFYHDAEFDPESSDIELALGVKEGSKSDKTVPGRLCAVTMHYGAYSKLTEAYGAIVKWIEANGYKIAAAPYEIYIKTQFDRIPVEEWETKIFFPVERV